MRRTARFILRDRLPPRRGGYDGKSPSSSVTSSSPAQRTAITCTVSLTSVSRDPDVDVVGVTLGAAGDRDSVCQLDGIVAIGILAGINPAKFLALRANGGCVKFVMRNRVHS